MNITLTEDRFIKAIADSFANELKDKLREHLQKQVDAVTQPIIHEYVEQALVNLHARLGAWQENDKPGRPIKMVLVINDRPEKEVARS